MTRSVFVLLLALSVALTGCTAAPPADTPQVQETQAAVQEKKFTELVKPLGRTCEDNGTLWLGYSGSGAAFSFKGRKLTVTISGDSAALTGDENSRARIAVFVNGERQTDDMINEREKTYTIIDSDSEQTADIRIVKLSESGNSLCGIKNIEYDGTISPAAENPLKIEFIGDSITCGYGVDDEVKEHHFSTSTEDCTKAYAIKTAEKLGADYSLVSLSGHGIVSGYSDGKVQQKNQVMQKYYDRFGVSHTTFGDGRRAYDIVWDHSRFEPDVIVINLGTNDSSWCRQEEDRLEDFTLKYAEFLKHLREVHPDSKIVCTLGIMGADLYPYIEEAVSAYTSETGDKNVYTMRFDTQDIKDGVGADWHPSEKTHEKAADKLAAYLREII